MDIKETYLRATTLIATGNPTNIISAANLLHQIVYCKGDGTPECSFWKGHACCDLADIYLVGVESEDYLGEDGGIYSDSYIEEDKLKSYDLYRRALKYGCHDGVRVIAEIYQLLGDNDNAAKMYAAVVKYGYKGAEDAAKILYEMIREGKIEKIPVVLVEPGWNPVMEFRLPRES